MASENLQYLIPKFHFKVEWTDVTELICSEVSGLNITQEPIEYRDGKSTDFFPVKRPGLIKFDDIVLKKAIFIEDETFRDWYTKVYDRTEDPYRDDVTVTLFNEVQEPIMVWTLHNAWVTKMETPDMNSTANEASMETITLAIEKITYGFGEDDGTDHDGAANVV